MTPDLGFRTTDCPQCGTRLIVQFGVDEEGLLCGWTGPHACPNWQADRDEQAVAA